MRVSCNQCPHLNDQCSTYMAVCQSIIQLVVVHAGVDLDGRVQDLIEYDTVIMDLNDKND